MICMCRPGYVGDADVACNLRKMIILVVRTINTTEYSLYISIQRAIMLSNHIKHIKLAYHHHECLSVFVVLFTNYLPLTSSATSIWLLLQL